MEKDKSDHTQIRYGDKTIGFDSPSNKVSYDVVILINYFLCLCVSFVLFGCNQS